MPLTALTFHSCDPRQNPLLARVFWQLAKNPLSNNVGGVKHVLEHTSVSTPGRAPFRSRSRFARFQPRLALNRSGQELGPTQPSLRSLTAIKIPFIRTH